MEQWTLARLLSNLFPARLGAFIRMRCKCIREALFCTLCNARTHLHAKRTLFTRCKETWEEDKHAATGT